MTEQTQPTDAEIDGMVAAYLGDCGPQATRVYSFARAVLAKWGTPAPVGVEPVARLEIGKTKGGVSLTHIAEPAAFQLPEGMYALYTTPQPTHGGAVPLTDDQIDEMYMNNSDACDRGDVEYESHGFARAVEAHHGIKEGGQHADR